MKIHRLCVRASRVALLGLLGLGFVLPNQASAEPAKPRTRIEIIDLSKKKGKAAPAKARPTKARSAWRTPTADSDSRARKIMQVTLKIQLKHKGTIRTRRSTFQMYMRPREKTIRMKNGACWLNLVASMKPPRQISFKGALQLGTFFTPIQVKQKQIDPRKPWTLVVQSKVKKASATIHIRVEMLASTKRGKSLGYKMKFKGVSLMRVLKRLAEFNNLRLAVQPGIPKIKRIKLNLAAKSRKALITQICTRYKLNCRVGGGVLWVKPTGPAAARK